MLRKGLLISSVQTESAAKRLEKGPAQAFNHKFVFLLNIKTVDKLRLCEIFESCIHIAKCAEAEKNKNTF